MKSYLLRSGPSALLITLLTILSITPAEAATLLRWKLQQGDRFRVQINQDTKSVMTVAGKPIETPQKMAMQISWVVESVDDQGIIQLAQTFERIKLSMQPAGQTEVNYDSASEQPPSAMAKMVASMLQPMIGVKVTQTMTDRGKVLAVDIPAEALKKIKSNPLAAQFFSEDSIKELTGKAWPELPEKPIEPGHQWTTDITTQSPIGKMKIHNAYTYKGTMQRGDRKLDQIGIAMQIEFEGGGKLGAQVTVSEQDNAGDAYFDRDKGHFVESKMVQKMDLEIVVFGNTAQQSIETTQQLKVTPVTTPQP
jgi:hypothetical protein